MIHGYKPRVKGKCQSVQTHHKDSCGRKVFGQQEGSNSVLRKSRKGLYQPPSIGIGVQWALRGQRFTAHQQPAQVPRERRAEWNLTRYELVVSGTKFVSEIVQFFHNCELKLQLLLLF